MDNAYEYMVCTVKEYIPNYIKEIMEVNHLVWLNNKKTNKYMSHRFKEYKKDDFNNLINSIGKNVVLAEGARVLITAWQHSNYIKSNASGFSKTHIGSATIQSFNYNDFSAEMAFLIPVEYCNKGVGSFLFEKIMSISISIYLLNKLWLGTVRENIGMRKLAEKFGMKCTSSYELKNPDDSIDQILVYEITKEEWNEQKKEKRN